MTGPFDTKDPSHQRPPWYEPKPGRSLRKFLKRYGLFLIIFGFFGIRLLLDYLF